MGKVLTKTYQGSKFGVVSRKTMDEIQAVRAELAQRRVDAQAVLAAPASASSKKTRGSREAPRPAKQEEPDAQE